MPNTFGNDAQSIQLKSCEVRRYVALRLPTCLDSDFLLDTIRRENTDLDSIALFAFKSSPLDDKT